MPVDPPQSRIGAEIGRGIQSARVEVDSGRDPASMKIVDPMIVADRHAHHSGDNFR
jgi:hypothetical protein